MALIASALIECALHRRDLDEAAKQAAELDYAVTALSSGYYLLSHTPAMAGNALSPFHGERWPLWHCPDLEINSRPERWRGSSWSWRAPAFNYQTP